MYVNVRGLNRSGKEPRVAHTDDVGKRLSPFNEVFEDGKYKKGGPIMKITRLCLIVSDQICSVIE